MKGCEAFLDAGDTFVLPSLDRYGRSLQDLISMVAELRSREIGFTLLHENLDTTTPGGRLVFHVFAALAEFIRELIIQGTHEGLGAARVRGRVGGRPTVATEEVKRRDGVLGGVLVPSTGPRDVKASGHDVSPHEPKVTVAAPPCPPSPRFTARSRSGTFQTTEGYHRAAGR